MFKHIVVAVDGSESSNKALVTACDLALKYDAELHLSHSPQIETTTLSLVSSGAPAKPSYDQVVAAGKEVVASARALAAENGFADIDVTVGRTDPARDILDCIDDVGADLVVMGRRGLGRLGGLLLGSVSQKVSHSAGCSCMTVD